MPFWTASGIPSLLCYKRFFVLIVRSFQGWAEMWHALRLFGPINTWERVSGFDAATPLKFIPSQLNILSWFQIRPR